MPAVFKPAFNASRFVAQATSAALLAVACLASASAQSATVPAATASAASTGLAANKITKLGLYLNARETHELVKLAGDKLLFLDVRSRGEVGFLGAPSMIDAHIPFMDMNDFGEWDARGSTYKLDANTGFADAIAKRLKAKGLDKTAPVVLICRSGDRSSRAVNALAELGYTQVYSVTDGYEGDMGKDQRRTVNGWKNAQLPWTYRLDKTKAWLPTGG